MPFFTGSPQHNGSVGFDICVILHLLAGCGLASCTEVLKSRMFSGERLNVSCLSYVSSEMTQIEVSGVFWSL